MRGAGTRRPVFRADQPFLFFILVCATGSVLFMGRGADPEAA
jgi:serine protease inhibitor